MGNHDLLDDREREEERNVAYGDLWEWWEERRLRFNTIVGSVGVVVAVIIYIFMPRAVYVNIEAVFLLLGITYAIVANLLYFLGWIIDAITLRMRHYPISTKSRSMIFRIWLVLAILPFVFVLLGALK
jgi:hypothetical protein